MAEEQSYTVYKHTTPAGKVYIGITGRDPEIRWDGGNGYRGNRYFWNAIRKHGWQNIRHEVLFSGLSKSEAEELERVFIAECKSADPKHGYNLDLGGTAVGKVSTSTRKKMAEASRQHWKDSEYRKKVTEALRGRTFTKEQREKLSMSRKGKKHSLETLRKISERTRGKNVGSDNAHARSVVCEETGQVFETVKHAAAFAGVSYSMISMACSGKRKSAGGYRWKYKTVNF